MPPLRTMPPAKPVKTERTHEENQERAYIAASRRSDRSLEARVESARRASEIHKKRTGRSLRVTEQDVINEEMYEEEDDDLPYPYRRLASHLMTNDSYLDRRLHSYLVNQVAMRTMVGQAVQKAWNEAALSPHTMQPGPISPSLQSPMGPPQTMSPRPSHMQPRQSPYPMPQKPHARSASVATPQEYAQYPHPVQTSPVQHKTIADRRMSAPVQHMLPRTPVSQQGNSPLLTRHDSPSGLSAQPHCFAPENASPQAQQQQPYFSGMPYNTNNTAMNPLSMSLPLDAQQLLTGAPLDWNDPMMQMLMQTPSGMSSPVYSYNPNGKPKGSSPKTSYGLNQTLLAPASYPSTGTYATPADAVDTPFLSLDTSYDPTMFGAFAMPASTSGSSGQISPGDGDFDSFINDGVWGEPSVA